MALSFDFVRRITNARPSPDAAAIPGPFVGICELTRGGAWRSDNGRVVLRLDEIGRLELLLDGKIKWRPKNRTKATKLLLNGRGELCLFDENSERLWVEGGPTIPDVRLHLQDDGNAVLYSGSNVLWNSGTQLS